VGPQREGQSLEVGGWPSGNGCGQTGGRAVGLIAPGGSPTPVRAGRPRCNSAFAEGAAFDQPLHVGGGWLALGPPTLGSKPATLSAYLQEAKQFPSACRPHHLLIHPSGKVSITKGDFAESR